MFPLTPLFQDNVSNMTSPSVGGPDNKGSGDQNGANPVDITVDGTSKLAEDTAENGGCDISRELSVGSEDGGGKPLEDDACSEIIRVERQPSTRVTLKRGDRGHFRRLVRTLQVCLLYLIWITLRMAFFFFLLLSFIVQYEDA